MPTPRNNPNLPEDQVPTKAEANGIGDNTLAVPPIKPETGELDLGSRSVVDANQAHNIVAGLRSSNSARSKRAAAIQAYINGQAPWAQSARAGDGKGWQSNQSFRYFKAILNPLIMQAVQSVNGQVYITRSSLSRLNKDWKAKSDVFQSATTRLFRGWDGWSDLVGSIATEDVTHGYAFTVFPDDSTWQPTFYQQETLYVPERAGQNVSKMQYFACDYNYMLKDFCDLFTDVEAAELAGYDIKNCTEAANHAQTDRNTTEAQYTQFRTFEEMIAAGTLGIAYANGGGGGQRCVKVEMLWNQEYDGEVSFWLLEANSGKLLRYVNRAYKSMKEALHIFAFEASNGKIHNSCGIGRDQITTALGVEKIRNAMIDQALMSSVMILRVPSKDKTKFAPVQVGNFMIVDKEIEIEANKLPATMDNLANLESRMLGWTQQTVGSYIASVIKGDGSKKTATEASIDNNRDLAYNDAIKTRLIDQFGKLITAMQVRAYTDEKIEKAFKAFQEAATNPDYKKPDTVEPEITTLIEMFSFGLSQDEIKYLRESPASGLTSIEDAVVAAGIGAVAQAYTGNPYVDQVELLKRNIEQMAGPEAARALVVADIDQTIASEAARQQLLEISTMYNLGVPVPVSPRDNHLIHAITLQTGIKATFPTLSKNPQPDQKMMKVLELSANHMAQHLAALDQSGKKSPEIDTLKKFHSEFVAQLKQVVEIQAQAAVHQQAIQSGQAANVLQQTQGDAAPAAQQTQEPSPAAPVPSETQTPQPTV